MKIGVYIFIGWAALAMAFAPSIYSFVSFLIISLYVSPYLLTFSYDKGSVFDRTYNSIGFKLLSLLLVSGFSNLLIIAYNAGHSFDSLLSIDGFTDVAISSTIIRYSNELANSGSPLLLALNLFGTYRIGLSYTNEPKYKVFLVFSPVILYTLLTTEKYPFFLAVVFFLLGLLSSHNRVAKK